MTKTLDEKLREIILENVCDQGFYDVEGIDPESVDTAIPLIKQAFADEPIIKAALAYKQAGGDTSDVFIISRKDAERNMVGYMSGSDWYERFVKEMGDSAKNCEGCSCDALEAAKRASSLDPERLED